MVVSLWIPDLFYDDVWTDDLQYDSCFCGCKSARSGNVAVGFQAAVALGESDVRYTVGYTVLIRFLRRDVDSHGVGAYNDDHIQATLMVRVLPYGNNDAGHL